MPSRAVSRKEACVSSLLLTSRSLHSSSPHSLPCSSPCVRRRKETAMKNMMKNRLL